MEYITKVKEEPSERTIFKDSEEGSMVTIQSPVKQENVTWEGEENDNILIVKNEVQGHTSSHETENRQMLEKTECRRSERKRKSSSSLQEILKQEITKGDMLTKDMKKRPPTLTQLLNGPNLSSVPHPVKNLNFCPNAAEDEDNDVQIVEVTGPPVVNKFHKPTLQQMLTAPPGGKNPLLTSILKSSYEKCKPETANSKTDFTKDNDQDATFVEHKPKTNDTKHQSGFLSAILGHKQYSPIRAHHIQESFPSNTTIIADSVCKSEQVKEKCLNNSDTDTDGLLTNSLLCKALNSQIQNSQQLSSWSSNLGSEIKQNSTSRDVLSQDQVPSLHQIISNPVLAEKDPSKPTGLIMPEITSLKTQNMFETSKINSLPKDLQSEEMINLWTNMITQKVISEFSKDVNATVNSFVKKAILESLSSPTSNQPVDLGISLRNGDENSASLASNLLSTLADKVGGATFTRDSSAVKPTILQSIFVKNEVNNEKVKAEIMDLKPVFLESKFLNSTKSQGQSSRLQETLSTIPSHLSMNKRIDKILHNTNLEAMLSTSSIISDAVNVLSNQNNFNSSKQIINQLKQPLDMANVNNSIQMILQSKTIENKTPSSTLLDPSRNSAGALLQHRQKVNKGDKMTNQDLNSKNSSNQFSDFELTQVGHQQEKPINQNNRNTAIQKLSHQGKSPNSKTDSKMCIQPVNASNQSNDNGSKTTDQSKDKNVLPVIPQPIQGPDGKFLIFSCNICGKRFQHHGTLSVHKRTHIIENGTSDFKCDICGKICTAQRYLDIHMKTHLKGQRETTGRKFNCSICDKEFSSEENLIIHKRLHLGEKLYQCEVCHTGFTRNSQLVIHMRIHSGEKPYVCVVCGKSFRQSNGLLLHQNVHMFYKPYKCEICGTGFSCKAHYEKHMKKEKHADEKRFKCKDCGEEVTDKTSLAKHRLKHEKEKQFTCKICGKEYTNTFHYRNHMKFHSGEKGYECPHCSERFEHSKVLTNHLITAHRDKEIICRKSINKEECVESEEDESNASDESSQSMKEPPGYKDMIMHISKEFEEAQNKEFDRLNQDYQGGLEENVFLSPDNVKVEPMDFSLTSDSLESSFKNNTLLNFDPTIVKEEPGDCLEEDYSVEENLSFEKNMDSDSYLMSVKEEPSAL